MRAGELRDRITIKRPLDPDETTQDDHGRDEGDPETVGSFWCKVETLKGGEMITAQQKWANARYKITMRRFEVSPKMYAEWKTIRLNILDVQNGGESFRPQTVLLAEHYEGTA